MRQRAGPVQVSCASQTDPPSAARAPRLPLSAPAGSPATPPDPPAEPIAPPSPTPAQVRAWARTAGLAVGDPGRLAAEVWQAYRNAHA